MRVLDIAASPFWEIPFRMAGQGGAPETAVLPLVHGTVDTLPPGVQAVLACSDLQGRVQARGGSLSWELLGAILAADLRLLAAAGEIPETHHIGILLLGDLYADAELQARGVHGDVSPVWHTFAADFRWVVGVAGNHDLIGQPPVPGQANAHLLDGKRVTVDGLHIAGISGIIGTAKEGRAWRRDTRSFAATLQKVLRGGPDVLLLHQGPDGGTPEQPGHGAIRAALEQLPGVLTLCGHVHWPTPLAALATGSQVLNVDGRAILLRSV